MPGPAAHVGAPFVLLTLYLAVAATWLSGHADLYHALIAWLAPEPFAFPFLDAHVVLAWAECAQQGIDVTITNPCDALGRTLAQSPLWLALGPPGATVSLTNIAGLLTGLLFLVSLFLLPPARSTAQAALLLPAFLSPAVAYGLERANTDLLVFAAVVAGARLAASPRAAARLAGHAAVLLAGLLKFYPLAALALLLRESPNRALTLACAAALVLAAVAGFYAPELARLTVVTGHWYGTNYGAICLLAGLPALWPHAPALTAGVIALHAALAMAAAWATHRRVAPAIATLPARDQALLLASAAVALGSFLLVMNGGYRAIFLLPVIALLPAGPWAAALRALATLALWAILLPHVPARFAPDSWLVLSWLLSQALWWALAGGLLAVLLALARSCPMLAARSPHRATPPA